MWGTTEFICAYRVSAAGQVCTWGREQKTNAHRRRPIRVKAASPWLDARVFVFSSVRANQIERKKVRKKLNFFSSSFFFFCSKRFVWFFERRDVSVSLVGFFRLHVGSLFFLSFSFYSVVFFYRFLLLLLLFFLSTDRRTRCVRVVPFSSPSAAARRRPSPTKAPRQNSVNNKKKTR